ncbi:major facilitator superfamily domain-containing protein [Aspergillus novoparasiticus]|uniref:Major facilitator superfamily domain-containing protein n=1 Tax=Aspergillus novoparasiticus TaxID=986946 RepID=A0A5N6EVG4_9EURO|nr:major facilitator superfamily domain-containing protein [Aspergillus novoparasiticus]
MATSPDLGLSIQILVYLMNYMDRNNYASARLQGLETDLRLTGEHYILAQVPSNLLLNYFGRPSLYLGFFVLSWGLVTTLTSQSTNFGGIVICRFMLGLWYKKDELNLRMAIFYSGSFISGAFGNLIAAGILNRLSGKRGLAAWQWLYVIEGSIMFFGITVLFFLPDFPHTWCLLTEEGKSVANRRMALDAADVNVDEESARSQLKGLNHIISLLLVAPPYIFMTFWSYVHGALSDRLEKRFWFFMYPIPLTVAGLIIFMTVDGFGPKYFSFFLVILAAAIAIINSLGNSASIWTPFTYSSSEAPYYKTAFGISAGLQIIAAGLALWLRFLLVRENKLLARFEDEKAVLPETEMDKLRQLAIVEDVDIDTARELRRGIPICDIECNFLTVNGG